MVCVANERSWSPDTYYVRPLHRSLSLLMWDYGALSNTLERKYIRTKLAMMKLQLNDDWEKYLTNQICESQCLIRQFALNEVVGPNKEKYSKCTVSQRDIQRVFCIFTWLKKMFDIVERYKDEKEEQIYQRALCGALAVVYYFRLNSHYRQEYSRIMDETAYSDKFIKFSEAIKDELEWMINQMSIPEGIAKTEALKENIYAIVICTMNRIPLIVIGQPGSSKTLAFKIVTANFEGLISDAKVFQNTEVYRSLYPHFYQCSRKSSSTDIAVVFNRAIDRQKALDDVRRNILAVVLMDEAGLPEKSHESLKVIHSFLDKPEVGFVGLSNYVLDAAKMNRAVNIFRPDASSHDVAELIKGCLSDNSTEFHVTTAFSEAYIQTMNDRSINQGFFGLRDLINFCNYIRKCTAVVDPRTILKALERNFNGSKHTNRIFNYFLERVSFLCNLIQLYNYMYIVFCSLLSFSCIYMIQVGSHINKLRPRRVLEVLKESLDDHPLDLFTENEVRYKLIIDSSKDESLVRLLFKAGVLVRKETRIYVCDQFLGDGESEKVWE